MIKRLRFYIPFLSIMVTSMTFAQTDVEVGVFAGTAYYMGDINPNRQFYKPSVSLGALYSYNLNTRYAIRINAYYARLSGSDLDFPDLLHPDRPVSPAIFNTSLIDLAFQIEYNFMPYNANLGKLSYTPYISTGIASAFVLGSDADAENFLSLPLGIGAKVSLSSRVSAGVEWSFRKAFYDRLDGLENPSGTSSILHNNDWYSFLGVFITFKFFNFATECPAYK